MALTAGVLVQIAIAGQVHAASESRTFSVGATVLGMCAVSPQMLSAAGILNGRIVGAACLHSSTAPAVPTPQPTVKLTRDAATGELMLVLGF